MHGGNLKLPVLFFGMAVQQLTLQASKLRSL
jgi:hypothetical protein